LVGDLARISDAQGAQRSADAELRDRFTFKTQELSAIRTPDVSEPK